MEQVEMSNMYINIDVNNGSEKCTEKTLRLLVILKREIYYTDSIYRVYKDK